MIEYEYLRLIEVPETFVRLTCCTVRDVHYVAVAPFCREIRISNTAQRRKLDRQPWVRSINCVLLDDVTRAQRQYYMLDQISFGLWLLTLDNDRRDDYARFVITGMIENAWDAIDDFMLRN